MIRLWVIFWEIDVFVHIEGHYISERNLACLVESDELLVKAKRR